jgi:limonene-1,2-epoxide hydrolase
MKEFPMSDDIQTVQRLYACFNARDIDGVLAEVADNVAWANAMDGGYVHGHAGIRAYWTRQWAIVSPHVAPVAFHRAADGALIAEVRQTIRDLDGRPLQGQAHGLKDKTVGHVFHLQNGKVVRFDVDDAALPTASR